MHRPVFAAVLLLWTALALAQEGGGRPSQRGPWWDACGEDIMKLGCADKKGKEEVKACLDAHAAELSPKCKDFGAKNKK
jgi:hypothetical protein